MSLVKVRPLTREDFEAYAALRRMGLRSDPTSFWNTVEEEAPFLKDKYMSRIEHDTSVILGAFSNNELVGVMTLAGNTLAKLRHKAGINGVYVNPEFRGMGISSAILQALLKKAFEGNIIEIIDLTVTAINHVAKSLYEKHGFIEYGYEQDGMRIDGISYDQYWMQLKKENWKP